MLPNLANSHHLVFSGWTHAITQNWSEPCGMQATNAFFNDPTRVPVLPCLKDIEPLPFLTE